jgi:glucose-6-phosphate dehydrogenase assembly protein OpcA
MSPGDTTLLPEGVDTNFAQIDSTMAKVAAGDGSPVAAARSVMTPATATVVAVGPCARLLEAATALRPHARAGAIRAILIASGDRATPSVRVSASEIALEGLREAFINNAVAALRLPSLPALVWWRGGESSQLETMAELADRLVIDIDDPEPVWRRIDSLTEKVAISDLRWTALTRWRALMAHFFDMPGVADAAARFTRLRIEGSDPYSARLFAGWLGASLKSRNVALEFAQTPGAAMSAVIFGNGREELALRRVPESTCVEGSARLNGRESSRIASLGEHSLADLIGEELRVRSHDLAFEKAVRSLGAAA